MLCKKVGVTELRYEFGCRDAIYRVSTKILALRRIIFIHEINNAKKYNY